MIFYLLVNIAFVYTDVTFEKIYYFSILILAGSFLPSIPIYIALYLKNPLEKRKIINIPFVVSFLIFIFWFFAYSRWVVTFNKEYLDFYGDVVKITQIIIAIMILYSLFLMGVQTYSALKENRIHYINIVLLLLIMGFLPYAVLYAVPVALGKKEIMPVYVCLIFSYLPLLFIFMYNVLFYRKEADD